MNRNHSIDTLRTVAAIFVVLLHASAIYVTKDMFDNKSSTTFWFANIMDSFTRSCVPIFVLISGRYLLSKTIPVSEFYRKRASKIIYPIVIWSIIYIGLTYFIDFLRGSIDTSAIARNLLNGKPYYHLWYLYMLIRLYAVTPILQLLVVKFQHKTILYLGFGLVFFGFSNSLYNINNGNEPFFMLWFLDYLGYFVLGFALKDHINNFRCSWLFVVFLFSSSAIAFLNYFTMVRFNSTYFFTYLSPLVIIASLSIYKLFDKIELKENAFSRMAPLTFGIYLVHAGVLTVISAVANLYGEEWMINSISFLLIKIILTLIISYISVLFMSKFNFFKKFI